MRFAGVRVLLFAAIGLAGCGGGGHGVASGGPLPSGLRSGPIDLTLPAVTTTGGDDWVTFAHDERRTARQAGLAFATLDDRIAAIDPASGTIVWSDALSSPAYASPAAVPSGLYVADDAGDVSAYR